MKNPASSSQRSLLWSAPLFDPSGYAEDARNLILAADSVGIPIRANELRWSHRQLGLDVETARRLRELLSAPLSGKVVNICHIFPSHFVRAEGAALNIGRTMFETDRIPDVWVAKCNQMDEIWVPCSFNVETFARAGVNLEKLRVLPSGLDAELYRRPAPPLPFREKLGFVFLSSFDWQFRKGWDLLLTAFCREFKNTEEVSLVLKTYSSLGKTTQELQKIAKDFVEQQLGMPFEKTPHIVFMDEAIPSDTMPRLYRSADCFVMPTRGEGWCRPYMEAMAAGVPVIGTRFGGHLDYMHDGNSMLIDCAVLPVSDEAIKEVPVFRGHRWAEPIVEHLRELMRKVFTDRKEAQAVAQRARAEILSSYSREKIGAWVGSLLHGDESAVTKTFHPTVPTTPTAETAVKGEEPAPKKRKTSQKTLRVQWEGSWFVNHSLAKVNRELVSRLIDKEKTEFSLSPFEKNEYEPTSANEQKLLLRFAAPLSGDVDCMISHRWPPRMEPPEKGHWVCIQPWEFGSLPTQWAKTSREKVDEVWVPSNYVRKLYIEAGLPPERITVIPNGVDTSVLQPSVKPMALPTNKRFKFLFVGGTIWRKGIDVLLTAYSAAFTDRDDVCLVIKDMGADTFYRGSNAHDMIHRIQDTPGSPEIIYLDRRFTEAEMASLYTACQCLVHPYRGEGFGMPVAEAMACGLPVVVTAGGACDDFCDDENSYKIPARRRVLPNPGVETVGVPWVLEPDPTLLARRLREIVADPEGREAKGKKGLETITQSFTWEKVAEQAYERLLEIRERPIFRFEGPVCATEDRIAILHFEKSLPGLDPKVGVHPLPVELSCGAVLSEAISKFNVDWVGIASPGLQAQGEPGEWYREFRKQAPSKGASLFRTDGGVFLFFPKVFSGSLSFDSSFESGAAILDFARRLAIQGVELKEISNLPLQFDSEKTAWKKESQAVDQLLLAAKNIHEKQIPEALDSLTQSLALKPDYEDALFMTVELLLGSGTTHEALSRALHLISLNSKKPGNHELLGQCYFALGDMENSEKAYQQALRLNPKSVQAHNDLATLYWKLGQHSDAIRSIQSAVALNPDDGDVIYNCAEILESVGKIDQVIPLLERYLSSNPQDEEVRAKLESLKK